jgi:hypothetical protein
MNRLHGGDALAVLATSLLRRTIAQESLANKP